MSNSPTKRPRSSAWRPLVLALVCLVALLQTPLARAETEAQTFAKAQELANAGRNKSALVLLTKILKKNPAHAPSRLLLGHILYASGQVGRAAKHFRHVNPEMIPPELAYEVGISFYAVKDCPHAEPLFAKVLATAKEAGLAHFYQGICAMQAHDTARAVTLLKEASGLPAPLEPIRRQALHSLEQGTPPPAIPEDVPVSTDGSLPPPDEVPHGGVAAKERDKDKDKDKDSDHKGEEKPAGFHFSYVEPGFLVTEKNESVNNVLTNSAVSVTTGFDVVTEVNATYGLPMSRAAGRPYVSLTGDFRGRYAKTTGTNETYQNTNGTFVPVQSIAPVGLQRFVTGLLAPEAVLPLFTPAFETFVGGSAAFAVPDLNTANLTSVSALDFGARYADKKYIGTFKFTYRSFSMATPVVAGPVTFYDYFFYLVDPYDVDAGPNTFTGTISQVVSTFTRSWEMFNLNSYFQYESFTPNPGYYLIGEASHLFFDLGGSVKLPFGTTVTVTGRYGILGNDSEAVADPATSGNSSAPQVQASASGSFIRARAEAMLVPPPFDWLYLYARYDYSTYSYSGEAPTLLVAYEGASAKVIASYGVQLGIKKRF